LKKSTGAVFVLLSLFMFFLIPLVESVNKTICHSSAICINTDNTSFIQVEGVSWIPVITLLIGLFIIFNKEIVKWFNQKQ